MGGEEWRSGGVEEGKRSREEREEGGRESYL